MKIQHETLLIPIIDRKAIHTDICKSKEGTINHFYLFDKTDKRPYVGDINPQQLIVFDNKEITFVEWFKNKTK